MVEAGVQGDRDFIVFSDANLLNELLQNGAAFIVVGGVVNIRPCKQLVADGSVSENRSVINAARASLLTSCDIVPAHLSA